jgi:hypothetical protein
MRARRLPVVDRYIDRGPKHMLHLTISARVVVERRTE